MALPTIRILSLCAGIGGLDLGLRLVYGERARTVCFVEGEAHAAAVLAARMQDGGLREAPIWSDLRTFDASAWRGCVDIVAAGYPCQPFSVAGRRAGANDPRHLWPHVLRVIEAVKPAASFCENVPGHLTLGFEQVCEDLSGLGLSVEAGLFAAEEVGAPHRRQRLYFIAHTGRLPYGWQQYRYRKEAGQAPLLPGRDGQDGPLADADGARRRQGRRPEGGSVWQQARGPQLKRLGGEVADAGHGDVPQRDAQPSRGKPCAKPSGLRGQVAQPAAGARPTGSRHTQPRLGRTADGLSDWVDETREGFWGGDWERDTPRTTGGREHRIDRLRALGNAVVPQAAALAWRHLSGQISLASRY